MNAVYVSSNSFKVMSDRTSEFSYSRRVKLDCGLDGIKYASVISSLYSSPWTTITINESDLTALLASVWYGVVQVGELGSLPNHAHDDSEGAGGGLTFLSFTDTPTTYSGTTDQYLQSTGSGTIFADIQTPTSTFIELTDTPSTYSGSSDRYLTSTGSGIEFTDLATPPSTFLDLTDTPPTYDNGKYLISTASSMEWTTISGISDAISRGKQSVQVEYATTSGIYINPGDIHMANSTYGMYELTSRLEMSFGSLVADTWYYVYADVSGSTSSLDATNFTAASGTPSIDYSNMGWYNVNDRCIGAFITDGSGNILPFYTDGNFHEYSDDFIDADTVSPGTTWTDVILTAPKFATTALATFRAVTFVANAVVYYRKNGATSGAIVVLGNNTSGRSMVNTRRVTMDSSQTIEFKTSVVGANTYYIYCGGFYIPNNIYTGA